MSKVKEKIILCSMVFAAFVLFVGFAGAQPPPGDVQQMFSAGLNSMQVVPETQSAGRGNCTVKIFNPWVLDVTCEYSGLSSNLTVARVRWASVGKNGAPICGFGSGGTSGTFSSRCILPYIPPATVLLPRKQFYIDFVTENYPNGEIRGQIKVVTLDSDVDGDGRTDAFLYRPSNACSYALCSVNNGMMEHQFDGLSSDSNPYLADFDGDGIADHSFTRVVPKDGTMNTIYVQSRDNTLRQVQWGNANLGDQSAIGDYDSDGRIDIAVFRPADGVWYILQSSDNQPRYEYWGTSGDRACPGDYDKDGEADPCVVRDENGYLTWNIRRSSDGQFFAVNWGLSTDRTFPNYPVDVDADGANDILVSRDENGQRVFYALRSSDNSMFVLQWGLSSDGIRIGDFDGDGKTDFGALRNIDGRLIWFVWQSTDGQTRLFNWGLPGDL